MKVFKTTPSGKEARTPIIDAPSSGLSGSGGNYETEAYNLTVGGLMLAKRSGQRLPPASPLKGVRLSNYQGSVYLTWEELKRAYDFANRERENELRRQFNIDMGFEP